MNAPAKLVILDRDGVINHDSAQFIKSPDEWKPIPGSIEAIARLNQGGYRVAVAAKQSRIRRRLFDIGPPNPLQDKKMGKVFPPGGGLHAGFFFAPTAPQN